MTATIKKAPPLGHRGKVYLVGAGPGDPALITLRGMQLLQKAEVVIYDYLASPKLLQYVPKEAELIYAGKKGHSQHTHTQAEINQMLVDRALAGKRVVRLKGGDPFIFGRGGEEIEELVEHGLTFEVVPGVTSATAAATYAGVPITHRLFTSSVAFITGHEDPTKTDSRIAWDKISTGIGTLVFYMGIKNLPTIAEKLILNGRDPKTPALVVRWASTPEQRSVVGTLENIAEVAQEAGIKPPALVVVGEVVKLRDKINWFEKRPLFGRTVMITRTREQASELVALLEEQGANCLELATISIMPPPSWEPLDLELERLDRYQWLLFASVNAVTYFFGRLREKGRDARDLKGLMIGAVGTTTAEALQSCGIRADLLPEGEFTGRGLAETLIARGGLESARVLIPRAMKASEVLPGLLRKAAAEVVTVPVYQNQPPQGQEELLRESLAERQVDLVTFTSSSTVTNFLRMLNAADQAELETLMAGVKVAAIGPITARTAQEAGLTVHVQPAVYTIPALTDEILACFAAEAGSQKGS